MHFAINLKNEKKIVHFMTSFRHFTFEIGELKLLAKKKCVFMRLSLQNFFIFLSLCNNHYLTHLRASLQANRSINVAYFQCAVIYELFFPLHLIIIAYMELETLESCGYSKYIGCNYD